LPFLFQTAARLHRFKKAFYGPLKRSRPLAFDIKSLNLVFQLRKGLESNFMNAAGLQKKIKVVSTSTSHSISSSQRIHFSERIGFLIKKGRL
jgi:hypothetical protein